MTTKPELPDKEIGEFWRRYKPLEKQDSTIQKTLVAEDSER
jgi:hypothetical protein